MSVFRQPHTAGESIPPSSSSSSSSFGVKQCRLQSESEYIFHLSSNRCFSGLPALKLKRHHSEFGASIGRIASIECKAPAPTLGPVQNPMANSAAKVARRDESEGHFENASLPSIPEARKLSFARYINRYSDNDGRYAIDVLVGGLSLDSDISREETDRRELNTHFRKYRDRRKAHTSSGSADSTSHSETEWIHQIRIQSPNILSVLSRAIGEAWPIAPRTFSRPFKLLIYHHQRMKEVYSNMELRWADDESDVGSSSPISDTGSAIPRRYVDTPMVARWDAYQDMKCYITFMENDILPLYHQFECLDVQHSESTMVHFDDLWYLFRVNELIFVNFGAGNVLDTATDGRQIVWRVYGIKGPDPPTRSISRDAGESDIFSIYCYYVDFSGDELCLVNHIFKLKRFVKKININQLDVYPVRFMDESTTLQELEQRGRHFVESVRCRHGIYNGRSLTVGPNGEDLPDADGRKAYNAEVLDSHVIVDFEEAIYRCPNWKPQRFIPNPVDLGTTATENVFPLLQWTPTGKGFSSSHVQQYALLDDGVWAVEWNKNLQGDTLLRCMRDDSRAGKRTTFSSLKEGDHCLLPRRLFGYVLRHRKFVPLDVGKLRMAQPSQESLDGLAISHLHKRILRTTMEAHFEKKRLSRLYSSSQMMGQDLISGKGAGTFILLHGPPGVGKTAGMVVYSFIDMDTQFREMLELANK